MMVSEIFIYIMIGVATPFALIGVGLGIVHTINSFSNKFSKSGGSEEK